MIDNPQTSVHPDVPTQAAPLPINTPSRHPLRRATITFLIIMVVIVAASVGGLALLRNSRNQPYRLTSYPGAKVIQQTSNPHQDHTIYLSDDPFQQVADFYAGQLGQAVDNGCKKLPLDQQPDLPGHSLMRCVVDQSVLDVAQTANITITARPSASDPSRFQTEIEVDRVWGTP